MRRHRSSSEFHLACPYTSQVLCRCRLYERAPPLWKLSNRTTSKPTTKREAIRQELLANIANTSAPYIDGAFAYAVHERANPKIPQNTSNIRLLAGLLDSAETRRDEAKFIERLSNAENAENERLAEIKKLRDEARRAAEPPPPPPLPPPTKTRTPPKPKVEMPSAEEVAKMEEIKEMERERAKIRKRERDRERRRLKKLEREEERLRSRSKRK